jgi:hypothetical protein
LPSDKLKYVPAFSYVIASPFAFIKKVPYSSTKYPSLKYTFLPTAFESYATAFSASPVYPDAT